MIILSGEDIKRKKEFLSLSKTYEIEVLFGISTDTGDVLGLIKDIDPRKIKAIDIRKEVANLIGPRRQTAPPFSSPGLDGKLFEKEIEIYSTRLGIIAEIRADDLLSGVETSINQVAGNFRQTPILACWRKLLNNRSNNFQTVNLIVNCSSGTYMRLLAEELGKALGLPALAYKIKRLRVGEYLIDDSLVL
jgi:tRNA pseudouridine55 synthase